MHASSSAPDTTGRPTWLDIDLDAVVHNFRRAVAAVPPHTLVYPVIKANGYGLGAIPIAHALQQAGASGFCIALVEEAELLRGAGITLPLVLMSGLVAGLEHRIIELDLQPFLYSREQALRLVACLPEQRDPPLTVHLKVDSGMGRLGLAPHEVAPLLAQLTTVPALRVDSLISHFACADEPDREITRQQIATMRQLQETLPVPLRLSLANSAGVLAHPDGHADWVRPGIMLYGASPLFPLSSWRDDGLRPVVYWYSRIIQIVGRAAGQAIGYGHTFAPGRPSRLAQIPVGYADGLCRSLGNRGYVLAAGQRIPIVGRVCMDLITLDITDAPHLRTGDRVTLLGSDGTESIDIEEMANWTHTIPYEVICRLGSRLRRHYRPLTSPIPEGVWSHGP
jgi:alanine racemase